MHPRLHEQTGDTIGANAGGGSVLSSACDFPFCVKQL
jgi:hypothetical protein